MTGVTGGGRVVKKLENWGDVIYGWSLSQRLITFSWQCTPIEKGQIIEGKSELLLSGLSGPKPLLTLTGR